jgi:hypothetical protein
MRHGVILSMPHATGIKSAAFEEIQMKRFCGFALLLVLFSVPAFASRNSQTVNLTENVKVGSTQIPAGDYKVTWTGSGSNAQVTLAQGGKAFVTVPAKVVEEKHNLSGFTINTKDGADVLETIELSNVSLVLEGAPTSGQ